MNQPLLRTAIHDWHVAQGARMVDFAGWSMPVQYSSIVSEHQATRQAVTLFDISHMGRLRFDGTDAAAFLDRLLTRRVTNLDAGQIRYALITNDQGGILDDVLAYHLIDADETDFMWLVVNAGNRQKIISWIEQHHAAGGDVTWHDETEQTAMVAVQGPHAIAVADKILTNLTPADMPYYTGVVTNVLNERVIVSRTGYTGEDGVEIIVPASVATELWESLLAAGQSAGVRAAGLGARDTLRLEAAMPLYGHELDENINPYQAGLSFAVNLKDRDFIGRDALVAARRKTDQPRRVGLQLAGKRVPRQHYAIMRGEEKIGEVSSGTFSPTLNCPIALGYVRPEFAEFGNSLTIDVRGRGEPATVVKLPFYQR
jgi:aminomethyltransferase